MVYSTIEMQSSEIHTKHLKETAGRAPLLPGCYLWKNGSGEILYVGKADKLRNRLKNYFNPDSVKTEYLMRQARDVEWITTESGNEALILEANLVKKYKPRFNVRLKDDKRYPYLCVSTSEMFPRLYISRTVKDDGNRYFGPFTDVTAVRNTMALIHKIFPIRKHHQKLPAKRPARPCMNFHIKRCMGPCTGNVTPEEYRDVVDKIILFLEGKREILEGILQNKMQNYSEKMDYENAAFYRDMLLQIRTITENKSMVSPESGDEDVIASAKDKQHGQMVVFEIRGGRMTGRKSFPLEGVLDTDDPEIISSFLRDYYMDSDYIPPDILCPVKPADAKTLEKFLTEKSKRKIHIRTGKSPNSRSLQKMAQKNAELLLKERILAVKYKERYDALEQIQSWLKLPELPSVIECYDISHFQGEEPVASGVQFVDGKPKTSAYRHYIIKHVEGINDPGMIQEVIARRLQRLLNENRALPDLIVIDGGYTQLQAACRAADALGQGELAMIGLAKKREEIYLPGKNIPVQFDRDSPGMLLLRFLRDEAHRFGITHNRKRMAKKKIKSLLENIPDIGPARRKNLLKHFLKTNIEDASKEDIEKVAGIGSALAEKIHHFYHEKIEK